MVGNDPADSKGRGPGGGAMPPLLERHLTVGLRAADPAWEAAPIVNHGVPSALVHATASQMAIAVERGWGAS
jgi:hypothetical protein